MAHFALDPVQALLRLQADLDRTVDRPQGSFGPSGANVFPPVNVFKSADGYVIRAEMPGIPHDKVIVQVESGQLTLAGERTAPVREGSYHRRERAFGRFSRTLRLPVDADPGQVEAEARNGVLTVRIYRHEAAKPRQVSVKTV
jgi:HSP20 family protein